VNPQHGVKRPLLVACFSLYIIIAWAACVYTFLHQDKEKEFVDISRFIFEAIGLIAIALASLFLPYAVNHLD